MHVQNVRDFPQTKFDSEINSSFLLNEHSDPRFLSQVCVKNSVIRNIFEEEKSLIVEHDIFWKIVHNCVYFGQGEDLELTKELSEKVQYSRNQANKNSLNEAILLMSINKLCIQDKTLRLPSNQDLILYESDSNG